MIVFHIEALHSQSFTQDSGIIIIGGHASDAIADSVEIIDLVTDTSSLVEGCGFAPPPILRVGGGVTLLLVYDAHSGRGFGRGQNMAAKNLKPKGKKTS